MLFIKNVAFSYGNTPVLESLTCKQEPGKIHGILGPNGSGKTTLLNILAGRLAADSGAVNWKDKPLTHRHVAYLQTKPYFYPMITGREYWNLFARQSSSFSIEKWNDLFELPLDQLIETYSTGMKKKLALIGAISLDRPVLLLDEPFNNLDVDSNRLVSKILRLLVDKGKLIVMTSHVIEMLTSMTDYIHLLEDGKISEIIRRQRFESWEKTYRLDEVNARINKAKDLL